jgi:hypothetical protein
LPRIQFSLKRLLIAITAACVLLFLSVTFKDFVPASLAFAFWCIVPTPVVIFAIYDRGDRQAFAIGALIPWISLLFFRVPGSFTYLSVLFWLLPMCAICGMLAAKTRRWIIAKNA